MRKKNVSKEFASRKEKNFEKKHEIICYYCKVSGHMRSQCPKLAKERSREVISHIGEDLDLGECFEPYVKKAMFNGIERNYPRDTDAGIDLCDNGWVNNEDLLDEVTSVRSPLDEQCICLPLAWVIIESYFGRIITKAAVRPAHLDQNYYLLGNKTAEFIKQQTENLVLINAMFIHSQALKESEERKQKENENARSFKNEECISEDGKDHLTFYEPIRELEEIVIPSPTQSSSTGLELVSASKFCEEQKRCVFLKTLWEKATKTGENEFKFQNDRLVRASESKRGGTRVQFCVPLIFRERIMALCHEEAAGHLGATKTKSRLLKCYFWPNCYGDIEKYAQSCYACQRVGKNRDRKRHLCNLCQ